jgi:hypothetical protein
MNEKRTCAVCERHVSPGYLMCHPHWQMVPLELRNRVWDTWNAWQSHPINKPPPPTRLQRLHFRSVPLEDAITTVRKYRDAAEKAIAVVREQIDPQQETPTP